MTKIKIGMLSELLLGTRNPSRVDLVRRILRDKPVRLVTLDELGVRDVAVEDGRTTAENAALKARAYFRLSGIPTLAMDGGLHIARFPPEQQPGVLVRRQAGAGKGAAGSAAAGDAVDGETLLTHYRRALEAVGGESPGVWTGSHALAFSEEQVVVESFTFEVLFTTHQRGTPEPGLSLDPIMLDPISGLYFTEMRMEERPYYAPVADFVRRWVGDAG